MRSCGAYSYTTSFPFGVSGRDFGCPSAGDPLGVDSRTDPQIIGLPEERQQILKVVGGRLQITVELDNEFVRDIFHRAASASQRCHLCETKMSFSCAL
jgi:hypothetical protein